MSRPYNTSFWACCSPFSLCLKGCCCPCVVSGKNHHRIKYGNTNNYSACNGWCMGWCGLTACGGFGWVLQLIDRIEMREKHGLEGSSFGACCASFCCSCCESIQTSKELDYLSVSQNPAVGYRAPQNMVADQKIETGYPSPGVQSQYSQAGYGGYPAGNPPAVGPQHGQQAITYPPNGYPANTPPIGHPANAYHN